MSGKAATRNKKQGTLNSVHCSGFQVPSCGRATQPLEGFEKTKTAALPRAAFSRARQRSRNLRRVLTNTLVRRSVVAVLRLTAVVLVLFPTSALAAGVKLDLKIERKPVTLLQNKAHPPHKLVLDMLSRTVGRTEFSTELPKDTRYRYTAVREPDGRYRIDPNSIDPVGDIILSTRITIRTPRLSDAQYNAVRNSEDYRFVYGLIRGIVGHEEEHAKEYVRFAKKVHALYAAPPAGENPVVTPAEGEDPDAAMTRYLNDRLRERFADAKRASDAVQSKIDNTGKIARIKFPFTAPVNGDPPPAFVYQTKGKLSVKFAVPKGNPRPPEPRTKY